MSSIELTDKIFVEVKGPNWFVCFFHCAVTKQQTRMDSSNSELIIPVFRAACKVGCTLLDVKPMNEAHCQYGPRSRAAQ